MDAIMVARSTEHHLLLYLDVTVQEHGRCPVPLLQKKKRTRWTIKLITSVWSGDMFHAVFCGMRHASTITCKTSSMNAEMEQVWYKISDGLITWGYSHDPGRFRRLYRFGLGYVCFQNDVLVLAGMCFASTACRQAICSLLLPHCHLVLDSKNWKLLSSYTVEIQYIRRRWRKNIDRHVRMLVIEHACLMMDGMCRNMFYVFRKLIWTHKANLNNESKVRKMNSYFRLHVLHLIVSFLAAAIAIAIPSFWNSPQNILTIVATEIFLGCQLHSPQKTRLASVDRWREGDCPCSTPFHRKTDCKS